MNQTSKIILAVIILVVFIGGGIYFWQQNNENINTNTNKNVNQLKTSDRSSTSNINTQNLNQNTNQPQVVVWPTYTFDNFTFDYPSDWSASEEEAGGDHVTSGIMSDVEVEFFDKDGNKVAELSCPILTTGYEVANKVKDVEKEFTKDGNNYKGELWVLDGLTDEGGFEKPDLDLLFMRRGENNSCQLASSSDWGLTLEEIKEIYDRIYESFS